MASAQAKHRWSFFRAGGFDQVKLESGADLAALDQLDQKLWVALSCPTTGLEFDAETLKAARHRQGRRIRAPEILAATKWACGCLKHPDDLLKGSASLPLAAINDATDEGKQLLSSARHILGNLASRGEGDLRRDTADTTKVFAQTKSTGTAS